MGSCAQEYGYRFGQRLLASGQRLLASGERLLASGVIAIVTLMTASSQATDYAVPGDFATIQAALNTAVAGDTITVSAGTYNEKVTFPNSGAMAQGSITLQAAPGPRPILDGTAVAGANMVFIDSKSYLKLIGFEIRNNLGVNDGSGVRIVGSGSNLEIRDNQIHDIRGQHAMGITVYGTAATAISNLIIDGNEIFDCEPFESEALTLNGNVTDFQVTNNIVRDVNNIGIDFIGGEEDIQPDQTKVARNGVCSGNHVLRARQQGGGFAGGIYVDGGQDIVIENNLVSGCDLGIEIGAENAGIVTSGIAVRNNLVYANEKAGIVFGGFSAAVGRANDNRFRNNTVYQNDTLGAGFGELWIQYGSGNIVENNIFVSTAQNLLLASYGGNSGNVIDYNLWFTAAGAGSARFIWNDAEHVGFATYQAATAQDANSLFADPLLVNPGAADFHLATGSPAINAGNPAFVPGAGEIDLDGDPRVNGAQVDIGVDEAGECGNMTVENGEQCDDGNAIDCDSCDSNCTTPACGNGVLCPPEACDDGNMANGDCCSSSCTIDPLDAPCSDGDLCTTGDACDGAGTCVSEVMPMTGCLETSVSGKASLSLKANDNPKRNLAMWKWTYGEETLPALLGNPALTTDYALCVYDEVAGVPSLALRAAIPPGPDWQAGSAGGYKYNDRSASAGGVRKILLKPGNPAKIIVKAKGVNLGPPALPLGQDPRVTVQVHNSTGACWSATYLAPADTNGGDQFKDKND